MDTTYTNHDGDICQDDYEHATKTGRYARVDTITIDAAGEIDAAWCNAGYPDAGMRIVPGKTMTVLTIPNDESAPVYRYRSHDPKTGKFAQAWYHLAGPTLAEWQQEREYAEASQEAAELRTWAGGA